MSGVELHVWPDRLRIRDTKLHDDRGGLGQPIYTTAGQGYEKREYVRADLYETLSRRVAELEGALQPLAGIPLEEFGYGDHRPEQPITGWNKHTLYVRDVLAARAALKGGQS